MSNKRYYVEASRLRVAGEVRSKPFVDGEFSTDEEAIEILSAQARALSQKLGDFSITGTIYCAGNREVRTFESIFDEEGAKSAAASLIGAAAAAGM